MATSTAKKSRGRRFFQTLRSVVLFPFTLVKTIILPGKALASIMPASEIRKDTIRKVVNRTYWAGLIGTYIFAPTIFTQTIPQALGGPVANFFTTTFPNAFTGPVANFFTSTVPNVFTGPVAGVFTSTIPGTFMGLASTVGSYSLPLVGALGLTGGIVVVAVAAVAAVAIAAVLAVGIYKGAKALWRGLKNLFKSQSDENDNANQNDASEDLDEGVETDDLNNPDEIENALGQELQQGAVGELTSEASAEVSVSSEPVRARTLGASAVPVPRPRTRFEELKAEIDSEYQQCCVEIAFYKDCLRDPNISRSEKQQRKEELKDEQAQLNALSGIKKVFDAAVNNPQKQAAAVKEFDRRQEKFEQQELKQRAQEEKNRIKQEAKAQKDLENASKPSLKQRVSEATKGFREGATQLFKQGVTAIKSVLSKAANLVARVAAKISSVVKTKVAGNQATTQNTVSAEQVIQPKGTARPLPATPAAVGRSRPLPPTPTAAGTARPLPPIPTQAVKSARKPLPATPRGAIKTISAPDAFLRKSQNGQQTHTKTDVKMIRDRAEQRRERVAELDRRVSEKQQGSAGPSLNSLD